MFKTQLDAINWLYGFSVNKKDRNLNHLHEILDKIDNPHLRLKTIHVAGTNGKGSTVSFMREAFMQSGYKVATFTSPFITCFGERMSINNEPMTEDKLIFYTNKLHKLIENNSLNFTSFDIITIIAFMYFSDEEVDIAIIETGIGGRLDSTNIIQPIATAITNVGHDHAEILGDTQLKRALEKLGIVKHNIPLFTTETDNELLKTFETITNKKESILFTPLKDSKLHSITLCGTLFSYKTYENILISMQGEHQFKNATLAIALLDYLKSTNIFEKLKPEYLIKSKWQGRFEYMQKEPPIIIDGAHNKEGIEALVSTIETLYPAKNIIVMFSAIATKDAQSMVDELKTISKRLILTQGRHPLSIKPSELWAVNKDADYFEDFKQAIEETREALTNKDVLIICGSLYFVSDVREFLIQGGINHG